MPHFAPPGALAIFNLDEIDFAARLTPARLERLRERLENLAIDGDMFARDVEVFGGAATADEIDALRRFVAAERARRGDGG